MHGAGRIVFNLQPIRVLDPYTVVMVVPQALTEHVEAVEVMVGSKFGRKSIVWSIQIFTGR